MPPSVGRSSRPGGCEPGGPSPWPRPADGSRQSRTTPEPPGRAISLPPGCADGLMKYVAGNGGVGMADRVLIVEDDPVVADLLRSVLERAGYGVIVFGDGVEALEWAFRERPDAIVLDVALPTIDGFEVLRRIRRDHRTMFAVVVLLTGMSGAAERAYGWDLEPDDYLVKPFDPDDLVARLGGRLRRVRQALATSWAMLPSG